MRFSERLWVPWSWWAIGLAFGLSFVTAIGMYGGEFLALASTIAATVLIGATLLGWGALRVALNESGLHAGRATLEPAYLGEATPLDEAETAALLGADARHDAYLCIRPYIRTAVRVEVTDPADPHAIWVVSSRNPRALADAVRTSVGAGRR